MRKDGAKEFLQCPENRVQIVFFVSKTCTRKRNLRQSQLRKANFEQKKQSGADVFLHAPFGRMLTEKSFCVR